ncbi:heterokaryon incompatibility protein-domain-containing protein [Podospora aff. communis PSN243]|uniref:Heterokaryon incompatibility protein-domain-containing protein n=1 Tax=Podospora aff. communis PSN243 TaxID=3040156 RepID=A0AAV9GWA0_9PEZI|nr:heterokaryon incompatibility protein-domain-containing protein [Podospora aff. communis PSN243]
MQKPQDNHDDAGRPSLPPLPTDDPTTTTITAPTTGAQTETKASELPKYQYSPLPDGWIRLIKLLPDHRPEAPIKIELHHHDLSSKTFKYAALSYFWGSGAGKAVAVGANGYIPVTRNLWAALRRLREFYLDEDDSSLLPQYLWVDSICINQKDHEERSRQVERMAMIYHYAKCVVVWLETVVKINGRGSTVTDSDTALEALENTVEYTRNKRARPIASTRQWQEVKKLLGQPWFRRVWVLQEAAAARKILMMSRSNHLDGLEFCRGLEIMVKNLPKATATIDAEVEDAARSIIYLIKRAGKKNTTRIVSATQRVDKVYALLGMASDDDIPTSLLPDYKVPWRVLFPRLAMHFFGAPTGIRVLSRDTAMFRTRGTLLGTWADMAAESSLGLARANPHRPGHVRNQDLVCQFENARTPTVIRPRRDYWLIVALGIRLKRRQTPASSSTCCFFVVWDWKQWSYGASRVDEGNLEDVLRRTIAHRSPQTHNGMGDGDRATRLGAVALAQSTVGRVETAYRLFKAAAALSVDMSQDEFGELLETGRQISSICGESQPGRQIGLIVDVFSRNKEVCDIATQATLDVLKLFLDHPSHRFSITDDVILSAVSNPQADKIIDLFLDQYGNRVDIHESLLKSVAAVGTPYCVSVAKKLAAQFPINTRLIPKAFAENASASSLLTLEESQQCVVKAQERVILLIGPKGSGKTSFVDKVAKLCDSKIDAKYLSPSTPRSTVHVIVHKGTRFKLIDTPGLQDKPMKNMENYLDLAQQITGTSLSQGLLRPSMQLRRPWVTGALYFHDISVARFSGLHRFNIEALCGKNFYPRVACATTFWETIACKEKDQFQAYSDELRQNEMNFTEGKNGGIVFDLQGGEAKTYLEVLDHFAQIPNDRHEWLRFEKETYRDTKFPVTDLNRRVGESDVGTMMRDSGSSVCRTM